MSTDSCIPQPAVHQRTEGPEGTVNDMTKAAQIHSWAAFESQAACAVVVLIEP